MAKNPKRRRKVRSPDIFDKVRLKPPQLQTVADRRFDDAQALRKTKKNARANGAMYLGGFVVECLLKANLLKKHSWLGHTSSLDGLSRPKRRIWNLCYRWHDLEGLLNELPETVARIEAAQQQQPRLMQSLKSVCARWTIYARYSPRQSDIDDATTFLNQIKELKTWLK